MLNVNKMTATSDLLALNLEDCKMLEIPSDQNLFMDLNEKDSETISGGYEVFTITNNTNYNVGLNIDGTSFTQEPDKSIIYTAHGGGKITFDTDGRAGYEQSKSYNLADGGVYEFQDNNYTPGNPYDFDIYRV